MDTKSSIIQYLEKHRSTNVSGQEIADRLNISRAAVWKTIQKLQMEGYQIEATPKKGYILKENSNVLSQEGIRCYLKDAYKESHIFVFQTLDSTNKRLKEMASADAPNHTILVANQQSNGVGRFGRSFYSPKDTGIYMSMLIRDRKPLQEATMITLMSAVAVCRVLKRHSSYKPQIKWVNDIYLDDKKVCGILSEAIIDFESGMSEAMIIGVGININTREFPEDIREIAASCMQIDCGRNQLIGEIASELYIIYEEREHDTLLTEYRKLSYVLYKNITYQYHHKQCFGYVKEINAYGNLVIENEEGIHILESGEITMVRVDEA